MDSSQSKPSRRKPLKSSEERELERTVLALLADEQYRGHPLRDALEKLWQQNGERLARLERVMQVADGYHSMGREENASLAELFDKQIRRIEKAVRISDRYQRMMREINHSLKEDSSRDHLTGLANRRMMTERLREEAVRAVRFGTTFSLAMLDIDHFKQVNDNFGHVTGDQVLVEVARAIESEIREYDLCGRWGGEEFLLLLPGATLAEAIEVVERVLGNVRGMSVPLGEAGIGVTLSIGVAERIPEESFSETIERADHALLEAKRAGRDRLIAT